MLWPLGSLCSRCTFACNRLYKASNSAFSAALSPRFHSEIRCVMSPVGSTALDYNPHPAPAPPLPRQRFPQMRLIHAPRILRQIVPRQRISPRPRPAAHLLILADTALAFALAHVPQRTEQAGVLVHAGQ